MMSMKGAGGEPLVLQFLDVSRVYPHAEVLRDDFYVETVPEMVLPEDKCLLARRGWYGMRDAEQAFEIAVRDFKEWMFSTCVFAHRSKFLLYIVHGDDYVGRVATWNDTKRNCLNGSSSRVEESWAPTACMRYEF